MTHTDCCNQPGYVAVIPDGYGGYWGRGDTPKAALARAKLERGESRKTPAKYYILTLNKAAAIRFDDMGGFSTDAGSGLEVYEDHGCDVTLHKHDADEPQ